jgi:APA family basic amino acid/polyamine antiporter
MADKVDISREVPGPASAPSGEESSHQFGLTAATALIVGSIIGVGIFNLPTSLAVYGPVTLVSIALTTVGALVKFVALAFIATVGLFYIKSANFTPGTSARSPRSARSAGGWPSP